MAYLELKEVTKRFGSVLANDHISLEVERGEIRVILGENGAGKSTLMKIIYGLYSADSGEIIFDGKVTKYNSPQQALSLGIGMVHQEFMLVDAFTVLENIMIGLPPPTSLFLNPDRVESKMRDLSAQFQLPIDCHAMISELSVGEQQRVEILKTLYHDVSLLILDEPTAVLTPQETDALFDVLKTLAASGKTIILITHKLREVMAIADKVSVLRGGKLVGTVDIDITSPQELARMMVGRDVPGTKRASSSIGNDIVLELKNVVAFNSRNIQALNDVSLTIHKNEIVGVAGVSGNGQLELANVIVGLLPVTKGEITLAGKNVTNNKSIDMIQDGVAYIPSDRINVGSIPDFSIETNLILKSFWKNPITKKGLIDHQEVERHGRRLIKEFDIRTPSGQLPVKNLSGGNIQKLILAREMDIKPILLVADQPSRGLDIGAAEYMASRLLEARNSGTGILLISEDLDELLNLSDRILVIYEGKVMKDLVNQSIVREEIGMLMAGIG